MTLDSIARSDTSAGSLLLSNGGNPPSALDSSADLAQLAAREASPLRQATMLAALDQLTGDRRATNALVAGAGVGAMPMMAQAQTAGATPGGSVSLPLDQLSIPDPMRIVVPLSRLGVLGAVLSLSGDTPQPTQVKLADDLSLFVSHDGRSAWFTKADGALLELGPIQFMPRSQYLNVPVTISNGAVSFDPAALQAAYGRPLPANVMAMARPAGVPAALQTTSSGIATAMAGAPDPCRNLPGQRHHIIPAEIMGANQSFLTRIGFRLDQPANMVKLPSTTQQRADMQQFCQETRPIHSGRHPADYGRAISDQLRAIEARGLPADQSRALVGRLMGAIRQEISAGGYASVNDARLAAFIRNLRL